MNDWLDNGWRGGDDSSVSNTHVIVGSSFNTWHRGRHLDSRRNFRFGDFFRDGFFRDGFFRDYFFGNSFFYRSIGVNNFFRSRFFNSRWFVRLLIADESIFFGATTNTVCLGFFN